METSARDGYFLTISFPCLSGFRTKDSASDLFPCLAGRHNFPLLYRSRNLHLYWICFTICLGYWYFYFIILLWIMYINNKTFASSLDIFYHLSWILVLLFCNFTMDFINSKSFASIGIGYVWPSILDIDPFILSIYNGLYKQQIICIYNGCFTICLGY